MFDTGNLKEIFQAMSRNKTRSVLTAFGIFWGIFMLVLMLGSGNGLRNGATGDFSGMTTNSFFLWTQTTSIPYKGFKKDRNFDFTNDDILAIKNNIPEAGIVSARNQLGDYGGEASVVRGLKKGNYNITADFPEYIKIEPIKNLTGRFINENDIANYRKVAIIGDKVVNELFQKDDKIIGSYIKIRGMNFMVVGHFKSSKNNDGGSLAKSVFIPFTSFQKAFNTGNKVGWFSITSKNNIPCSVTEEKVKKLLAERHHIHPDDKYAIGSWNAEKEFRKIQNLFSGIELLIWVVGIGTLLSGLIGISNIMMVLVKERTKEIGIKRAIGATPLSIIKQLLSESLMLTLIAGYTGMVCGLYFLDFISGMLGDGDGNGMFKNPEVDLFTIFIALVILIVGGIIAGLLPAVRAIQIKTVDALKE